MIIRWVLFFGLITFLYPYIALFLPLPITVVVDRIMFEDDEWLSIIIVMIFVSLIFSPISLYLYQKIFGIFKDIDNLKIITIEQYSVVSVVSLLATVLLFLISSFVGKIKNNDLVQGDIIFFLIFHPLFLPLSFTLFKFVQKLSLKYPKFKKFTDLFSLDFYRQKFISH